jgi:dihydropteroate synthase
VAHAERLLDEGADILDIGGESTRPGARVDVSVAKPPDTRKTTTPNLKVGTPAVSGEEECRRVLPVIAELKKKHPTAVLSVDTYKSDVARAAVGAGAEIVNDVSGFRWDGQMAKTIADLKCGAVLMHMRGRPEEWRTLPPVGDIVLLVKRELKDWAEQAVLKGVRRERIAIDPGFGFGKSFEQNYPLIRRFNELQSAGFPLLAGTSRKSFIGRTLANKGKDVPPEGRLYGTLATQTALILSGAHIVRTHDVRASLEAARIADAILAAH